MDDLWFKEDRTKAKAEKLPYKQLKEETEKALKNSTLLRDRLERILDEWFIESLKRDEDYTSSNWELHNVANISERKTLRKVLQLINFKED